MDTPNELSLDEITLRPADEALSRHAQRLSISIREVAGDKPDGRKAIETIDQGTARFESSIRRLATAKANLATLNSKLRQELPEAWDCALGVTKSTRYVDPAMYAALKQSSAYSKDAPLIFVNRCLTTLEEHAPRFSEEALLLRRVGHHLHSLEASLAAAKREQAEAELQYQMDRCDLEALLRAGTTCVLRYAKKGSEALERIRYKGGKKPGRKPKQSSAPANTEATSTPPPPVLDPAANAAPQPAQERSVR